MTDVLCISDCCCDLIFAGLPKMPELGREEWAKGFLIKAGGGSNTALALARLGMNTAYLTAVGNDFLGKIIYDQLKKNNVNMSYTLIQENMKTSVSAVLSTGEDRGFASYFFNGITNIFSKTEIKKAISECNHIHTFAGYCLDYPIAESALASGATLSLDTSWLPDLTLRSIEKTLKNTMFFKLNDAEALSLTQCDTADKALDAISNCCETAVITLGSEGYIAKSGSKSYRGKSKPVDLKDTTGAGDLFCAGLIYGIKNGFCTAKALEFAAASGTLGVTFYGGMDDLYTKDNIEILL